jgi:hypothetical protein
MSCVCVGCNKVTVDVIVHLFDRKMLKQRPYHMPGAYKYSSITNRMGWKGGDTTGWKPLFILSLVFLSHHAGLCIYA